MVFKDRTGKNLEPGQKVIYLDRDLLDGEILEVEQVSVLDGNGQRMPRVAMKIYLNFQNVPPGITVVSIGNLRVVEDAPASKLSSVGNLTRH